MQKKLIELNGKQIFVCDNGELFNAKGNKYKLQIDKFGYCAIFINKKRFLVHRLVAMVFDPNFLPEKQVHHKNENKQDNRIENLESMEKQKHQALHKTKYEKTKKCVVCGNVFTPLPTKRARTKTCCYKCNITYQKRLAARKKRKIAQLLNGKVIKIWDSARDVQNETGFFESNINKCCNGVIKHYKGFEWRYVV